jgi:hypothetical protein
MVRILQHMLESDETITARGVARRHPSVQHASSITRHENRSELLARYQAMQNERRAWLKRLPKHSQTGEVSPVLRSEARAADCSLVPLL